MGGEKVKEISMQKKGKQVTIPKKIGEQVRKHAYKPLPSEPRQRPEKPTPSPPPKKK